MINHFRPLFAPPPPRQKMALRGRKWPLLQEMTHSWPEMTVQAVEVTGQSLSHTAKRSKITAFCFFCILFSAKQLETTVLLVLHSHQAVKNDCFKILSVPEKKF